MLQESARRGLQIDFDKLEAYVAQGLAYELRQLRGGYYEVTFKHFNYAFDLIALSAGLGHAIQLSRLWNMPNGSYKRLEEPNTVPTIRRFGRSRPVKGADNLLAGLQEQFNKDELYLKLAKMDVGPEGLVAMLSLARAAGISIVPERLVKLGYNKIIEGKQPEYAIDLIKTGEKLGANISTDIMGVVAKYEQMKKARR